MTSGGGRILAFAEMALVVGDCLVTNLTEMADTGSEFPGWKWDSMFEEHNFLVAD